MSSRSRPRKATAVRRPRRFRPFVEPLEERWLPTTFTVNTTGDSPLLIFQPGGGVLTSLRAAIYQVNGDSSDSAASPDTITFNVPQTDPGYDAATGVWTIAPGSALPTITRPVVIDGYSQPGASPNTQPLSDNAVLKIELSGKNAGTANGLDISGGSSQVDGLIINSFDSFDAPSEGGGIRLDTNGGDTIVGNFIGTNYAGLTGGVNGGGLPALENVPAGVAIFGCANNVVGDGTYAGRNILSGNNDVGLSIEGGATGNRVSENFIGLDASGATALGNGDVGIEITNCVANTIEFNNISGNVHGIAIGGSGSTGNRVRGDLIGTDTSGLLKVPNTVEGVLVFAGASDNFIGDGFSLNVISGNGEDGVRISGSDGNVVQGTVLGLNQNRQPLGNGRDGIRLEFGASNNRIGGSRSGTALIDALDANNLIGDNGANGVEITGAGTTANIVQGNDVGTDATGATDLGNSNDGVLVTMGASGNTVGGASSLDSQGRLTGAGNVISGNGDAGVRVQQASGNMVQGNFIGTDVTGKVAVPNDPTGTLSDGVDLLDGATDNVIGGANSTAAFLGNLISGNGFDGVFIANLHGGGLATGNAVQGNFIGTDITGTQPLPNQANGVHLEGGAVGNTIGGTDLALRNLISGNGNPAAQAHTQFPIVGAGVQIADFFGSGPIHDNKVLGIYIGTDTTGTKPLGNLKEGVVLQQDVFNNTVGPGNIISGNGAQGVNLSGGGTTGNVVENNSIGLDAGGSKALGNAFSGVIVWMGASGNRVGGPGVGNVISGNGIDGVNVQGSTTAGNVIESNRIGTDAAGQHALPNARSGVYLTNDTHGNRIGTDGDGVNDPAERNVLSGNNKDGVTLDHAPSNTVAGNYIGTDVSGTAALPNGDSGVTVVRSESNRIGAQSGDADGAGERNVISGNVQAGVTIDGLDARGNSVASNFIGTDADGQAPLPNGVGVRLVNGANGNIIGGSDPGLGNVISGNKGDGLDIRGNGLPPGAVADYRAEGDATDALGFNNGTIQGNVTFEPGRFGQAFHFEGATGEGVHIPASPSLNVGAGGGLTLTAWINPDDVSSQEPIIEWTNGVHLWFSVTFGGAQGPGNLYANLPDAQGNAHIISSAPRIIQPHQWQFVALTYDKASGVATLYLNGAVAAQQTLGSFTPNTTGDVNLGHRVPGSFTGAGQLAGGLDEVGIYNTALFLGTVVNVYFANGQGLNIVGGNRIGTALDPSIRVANGGDGLVLEGSASNQVGSFFFGAANVIAGNSGRGVLVTGTGSVGNVLSGNFIGTDATGTVRQGNASDGVRVSEGAFRNLIGGDGHGSTIAYNSGHGVVVGNGLNDSAVRDQVTGNRIFGNQRIGIDLGNDGVTPNLAGSPQPGANHLVNFPVITSARAAGNTTVIVATIHGTANASFDFVDFFANSAPDPTGYGQGEAYLGEVRVGTDSNGNATVTDTLPLNLTGKSLSATLTDNFDDTSEFAADVAVTPLVPTLTGLGSTSTTEGTQTLTVSGTDFVSGAVVSVNGTPLATTFMSGTQLMAAVPACLFEEGTAIVTVTNPPAGGGTSNALNLTVTDAPLNVTASALTATGSAPFSGVVGMFTDTGGSEPAGSYTALINWGDGSSSPGTVVAAGNGFNVIGSHTYLSASVGTPYTTTVTVTDEGGSTASGNGSAAVAHAPLTVWGQNVSLTEGTSGSAVVAFIRDPDPRDGGSDFNVTIDWGDGKSSAGTVSPANDGLLQVSGSHAYGEEGNHSVSVSIQDARGGSATATASAAVADAPLTAFPVTLTVTGDKNFAGIVALFTDANPTGTAGPYTVAITWDDGTTSAGTVSGSGTLLVSAAHRFGKFKGPHTIVITITDAGGASVTFTDTVIDPAARHHARHHAGLHHRPQS
jgi:hypothetical protein